MFRSIIFLCLLVVGTNAAALDPVWSFFSLVTGSGWSRPECVTHNGWSVEETEAMHTHLDSEEFQVYKNGKKAVGDLQHNHWAEAGSKIDAVKLHLHKFRERNNALIDEVHDSKMKNDGGYRRQYWQEEKNAANIQVDAELYNEKLTPWSNFRDDKTSLESTSKGYYLYSPKIEKASTEAVWNWHKECNSFSTVEWLFYLTSSPFRMLWWLICVPFRLALWGWNIHWMFGVCILLCCIGPLMNLKK